MDRFEAAISQIDAANMGDPETESHEGRQQPSAVVYAKRMTQWLARLCPEASEALRLAARSQHICRWEIPRQDYPMNRQGYLQWRRALAHFHADKAGQILHDVGYDAATVARVQALIKKQNLKSDPETQLLEDVICLVFLESYFADFSRKHDEDKIVHILRRTWEKMSPRGRAMARTLELGDRAGTLLERALEGRG